MSTREPDIDDIAVERRIGMDRTVFLNKEERGEAVRILNARGLSDTQIADRLGYAHETIMRIRHRNGFAPIANTGRPMAR